MFTSELSTSLTSIASKGREQCRFYFAGTYLSYQRPSCSTRRASASVFGKPRLDRFSTSCWKQTQLHRRRLSYCHKPCRQAVWLLRSLRVMILTDTLFCVIATVRSTAQLTHSVHLVSPALLCLYVCEREALWVVSCPVHLYLAVLFPTFLIQDLSRLKLPL